MAVEPELLREQAASIVGSGALGRSRSYARLLEFLVECAQSGRSPKELEIAMEVFGRGADFDPSQDSMVRVYAHNLRQKLEHYYATTGRHEPRQIVLARGEYRITLPAVEERTEPVATVQVPAPAPAPTAVVHEQPSQTAFTRWRLVAAGAALLAAGIALGAGLMWQRVPAVASAAAVAKSPLWADMLDDELPILVVVGDYYIYGELDDHGDVTRLVRDFNVGSSAELDELMKNDTTLMS